MTEDPLKRLEESVKRREKFLRAIRELGEEIRKEREEATGTPTGETPEVPIEEATTGT